LNALSAADAASRPAEEVLRDLGTSAEEGLGAEEAARRLEEVGPNVLDREQRKPPRYAGYARLCKPLQRVMDHS